MNGKLETGLRSVDVLLAGWVQLTRDSNRKGNGEGRIRTGWRSKRQMEDAQCIMSGLQGPLLGGIEYPAARCGTSQCGHGELANRLRGGKGLRLHSEQRNAVSRQQRARHEVGSLRNDSSQPLPSRDGEPWSGRGDALCLFLDMRPEAGIEIAQSLTCLAIVPAFLCGLASLFVLSGPFCTPAEHDLPVLHFWTAPRPC